MCSLSCLASFTEHDALRSAQVVACAATYPFLWPRETLHLSLVCPADGLRRFEGVLP